MHKTFRDTGPDTVGECPHRLDPSMHRVSLVHRESAIKAYGEIQRWAQSACTGSCNQGRACDCVEAVPTDTPEPMRGFAGLRFVLVCWAFTAGLVGYAAWVWMH